MSASGASSVVANYSSPKLFPDGGETTRKRLFGIFRCDGLPIVWPAQTNDPRRRPRPRA
jgi:hypothetical protein